jgi:hypothetical protein
MGLSTAAAAPAGAAEVSAAAPAPGGRGEVVADFAALRLRADAAVAGGAAGVFFRLPVEPAGADALDFPEETQALGRVLRELRLMSPVVAGGETAPVPFNVPDGVRSRAWTFAGRRYVLLVNVSGGPQPLDAARLDAWRALFAVRADPAQSLESCAAGRCLAAGAALWLEGRPGL